MRTPSRNLVVDAAILVAAVRGRSFTAVIEAAAASALFTTDRAAEEARRRIALGLGRPELLEVLDLLVAEMVVTTLVELDGRLVDAARALMLSVPSRNGSTRDAHVLALAWEIGGDIWTTDRDFAGTGVASWSTANLMRALAPAPRRSP